MYSENTRPKYTVEFSSYSQRHYIKKYEKKYGRAWEVTRRALIAQFERIESLVHNKRTALPIRRSADNQHWIIKHEFAVAGTQKSPKGSGNRVIICVDRERRKVTVLMVYHKNDLGAPAGSETATWQRAIRKNCAEYIGWWIGE